MLRNSNARKSCLTVFNFLELNTNVSFSNLKERNCETLFLNIFKNMGEIGYKIRFSRPLETYKIRYSIIVIGTAYMSPIPTWLSNLFIFGLPCLLKSILHSRKIIIHIASRDNSFHRFFL